MAGEDRTGDGAATGSNIRLQAATSRKRSKKSSNFGSSSSEIAVGFINFVRNHAIVSLAVGFVIATQVQTLVKQLVTSFITPTFQLFFKGSLAKNALVYHLSNGRTITYSWGAFVSDVLDFMFVLGALYLIIRFFKLDKLDRKNTDNPPG